MNECDEWLMAQMKMVKAGRGVKCGTCMRSIPVWMSYRCLYCGVWMCQQCMEKHLGQTREEYNTEHHADEMIPREITAAYWEGQGA